MFAGAAIGTLATAATYGVYRRFLSPVGRRAPSKVDKITLYYHADYSGRLEGALLLLEDHGVAYKLSSQLEEPQAMRTAGFAPPFCVTTDGTCLSQAVAICMYISIHLGACGPEDDLSRCEMMRAALNAEDLWAEAYRAGTAGLLEGRYSSGDEPTAALEFARSERLTRWLLTVQAPLVEGVPQPRDYAVDVLATADGDAPRDLSVSVLASAMAFDEEDGDAATSTASRVSPLTASLSSKAPNPFLFGSAPCFVDYHLLGTLRALEFMYPKALRLNLEEAQLEPLKQWWERMHERPRIAEYLASERALPVLVGGAEGLA